MMCRLGVAILPGKEATLLAESCCSNRRAGSK
jgi:hypothetical protein